MVIKNKMPYKNKMPKIILQYYITIKESNFI